MIPLVMKLLHILTALWFISGLLGRTLTMWQAERTANVQMVETLVRLAGYFERWMVIPGSFAVLGFGLVTAWLQHWSLVGAHWLLVSTLLYLSLIPIIPLIFLPQGKVFAQTLQQALAVGKVTPTLTAAFHHPLVRWAHIYELAAIMAIIVLMVMKPF